MPQIYTPPQKRRALVDHGPAQKYSRANGGHKKGDRCSYFLSYSESVLYTLSIGASKYYSRLTGKPLVVEDDYREQLPPASPHQTSLDRFGFSQSKKEKSKHRPD
ncbi:unnamed protein product [Calicophoron daubneyi]|uniref:Uncharacterized protein n=1 Tax=Calicophoron daubneyi TaxID=300641 RepID=A0AAV2TZ18_CALDB